MIAGVAEPVIFDRPKSCFGGRVRPARDFYSKLHGVSRGRLQWVARLPELWGKRCVGAVLQVTCVQGPEKEVASCGKIKGRVGGGHGGTFLQVDGGLEQGPD